MKVTTKELGWIIVHLAAIILVIGMIVLFKPNIGGFFQNIFWGKIEVADKVLGNVDGSDIGMDDPNAPKPLVGEAYAIFSDEDRSLTFVRSETEIVAGTVYNGKTVTNVYTGFETETYEGYTFAPWYSHSYNISSVVIKDEIRPVSTAEWFRDFRKCSSWDLAKLNTSNTTDMSAMFVQACYDVSDCVIDVSNWDTSNVTDMGGIFSMTGYNSSTFNIDVSSWDTSNVTSMSGLFNSAGRNATTWDVGDLSGWDTSNVTNMNGMFGGVCWNASSWTVGDLSNWDTSKVEDMAAMFYEACFNSSSFDIGNIGGWDTSSVTNMYGMFYQAGCFNATTWNVGDLSNWDTSNVTNMSEMFSYAGYKASYSLDLSRWDVGLATDYSGFNAGVSAKVKAPAFGTT